MKNRVVEGMTRIEVRPGLVIRVWRDCGSIIAALRRDNRDIWKAVSNVTPRLHPDMDCEIAAYFEAIERLPDIAAVEILVDGQGVVVYPDWK